MVCCVAAESRVVAGRTLVWLSVPAVEMSARFKLTRMMTINLSMALELDHTHVRASARIRTTSLRRPSLGLRRRPSVSTREVEAIEHFNRGIALAESGEIEAAIGCYELAAEHGDTDLAPKARFNLAVLKSEAGDVEGAKQAYEAVIAADHPDARAKAAFNLGRLGEVLGDTTAAVGAFTLASETEHEDVVPQALRQIKRLTSPEVDCALG